MAIKNSRRIPLEKAASAEEIIEAINALTRLELGKLGKFAQWRIRGLGRTVKGRDWQDLLHEAVTSFLSPDGRRWNREAVDFPKALKEAIRSISSNWKRSFDESESESESNDVSNAPAPMWNTQTRLEAKEKLEIIENLLAKRELAALIFMGLKDGMSGAAIRDDLGISVTQFETEMTWIRRTGRPAYRE